MKKIFILNLLFFFFYSNFSYATTFTFSGSGNWNSVSNWVPSKPVIASNSDSIIINGHCTINATDTIKFGDDTCVSCNYLFSMVVNDTVINNGSLSLNSGSFTNKGYLLNNGAISTIFNEINLAGNVENYGLIFAEGELGGGVTISNNVENYGTISTDGVFINSGIIHSYSNAFIGSGPLGNTINKGEIYGKTNCFRLNNIENSILSPGIGLYNTDTIKVDLNFTLPKKYYADINGVNDNDIIILDNFMSNSLNEIGELIVQINPSFTPMVGDTFVFIKNLNLNPSLPNSFSNFNINPTLPTPPAGYVWVFKQEASRVYLTLDFEIVEFPMLFSFYAEKKRNTAILKYKMFEKNADLDYFVVERASKDFKFMPIGKIKYDEAILNYNFIDENPIEGDNIYHYIAYNKDGKGSGFSSNAYLLNFNEISGVILNSIVENNLQISLNSDSEIKIINQNGDVIYVHYFEKGQHSISLSHLTKGIYFVKTENKTYKIVKL